MLLANRESAELAEPSVGAPDEPSALAPTELSAVLIMTVFAVLAVRNDEIDDSVGQTLPQRVGVAGAGGDHALRLLLRPAFGTGEFDFGERGFDRRNFCRRGTFQPNTQRKTLTVN
jgi:hypothetical protein